ncbi:MAG TPA: YbjQ family protein [Pirellulales bacterium]|nr:YbjQ family protein [Pirellulales bacterium]
MVVTTGNEVEGYKVASYIGLVRGIVVRSPNIAQGLMGGLKAIVGGNIESYATVCEHAREEAYERMEQHAAERGADAVIAVRYDATEFMQGATEVLCYGTAVKLTRTA